ncbi:MAG: hypothetical protein BWY81_00362 [Firmicutes bacterium ADurb.Bin467]|nr:MAG: hypothetical protein BWY81_00362 [Firmicutes bacterium ADurb.Bin467]
MRDQRAADAVGDAHIVAGELAVRAPGEVDRLDGGVEVAYAVDRRVDRRDADLRRADLARGGRRRDGRNRGRRRLDVGRRVLRIEQRQRLDVRDAGHVKPRDGLEQPHSGLRDGAEVAGDVAAVVVELREPPLHVRHAAVRVAALQRDIAAELGRVPRKQPLLDGGRRDAVLLEPDLRLETLHGQYGRVVEGASDGALEVVELLEPRVQFLDAVAGVALLEVYEAGCRLRARGIEPAKRLAGRRAGLEHAVFALEEADRLLGARAVDAVHRVREEAQRAEPLLQYAHAQARVSAGERLVRVVGGKRAGEQELLELRGRDAVDREAAVGEVGLQQLHRVLRLRAEDAVGLALQVAELDQHLLELADVLAAAAARERSVLHLRLDDVGALFLVRHVDRADQDEHLVGHLFRGRLVAEAERRDARLAALEVDGRKHRVDVELPAHALDAKSGELVALGPRSRREVDGREFCEPERVPVKGEDRARRFVDQKQLRPARGELQRHRLVEREQHLPRERGRVELLEPRLRAHGRDIVHLPLERLICLDAEVDELGLSAPLGRDREKPLVAEPEVEAVLMGGRGRDRIRISGERAGRGVVEKRAGAAVQFDDEPVGRYVKRGHVLRRRPGGGAVQRVERQAHHLRAVRGGDVEHRIRRERRRPEYAVGQRRLLECRELDRDQLAPEVVDFLPREIHHALLINPNDLRRVPLVDLLRVPGQKQPSLAVQIRRDAPGAPHEPAPVRPPRGERGNGDQRDKQQRGEPQYSPSFHPYPSLVSGFAH